MNEREIAVLEKEVKEENKQFQKIYERAKRILNINEKILKLKGLIFKRCPICNSCLKEYDIPLNTTVVRLKYYSCACGYEFSKMHFGNEEG